MFKPFFKKGSILLIHLIYHQGSIHKIQGLCIKKKNKGIHTYFSLKQIINNETIIQTFPLYSPFIKKIQVIKK